VSGDALPSAGRDGHPPPPIECTGAPRDVGLDQGRACRPGLAVGFASLPPWRRWALSLGRSDRLTALAARDLRRHFPHQAEVLEGLARGAGVPRAWLAQRLARAHAAEAEAAGIWGVEAVASGDPQTPLLARGVDGDWILRRVRPDGGFAALELARSWLPSALAGVNDRGLAVVCVPGAAGTGECAAPALLLGRDCLQQFDSVGAALEWCEGRPAGGRATLLAADAGGEVAAVEVAGADRRVRRADGGLLVMAPAERGAATEKSLRAASPVAPEAVVRALTAGSATRACVVLDPAERRLGVAVPGAALHWLPV
jgi:hypothetical protein